MTIEDLRRRWSETLTLRMPCKRCGSGHVWRNGIRLRTASLWLGDRTEVVTDVPVRRLKCGDCKCRWSLTPEGVSERGHYQPCVVAQAVASDALEPQATSAQVASGHGCHVRTLWRWVARVAALVTAAALARCLAEDSGVPVLPSELPLRARLTARRTELARQSVQTLVLLDALVGYRGLPLPGLAHARLLVPAHAGRGPGPGGATSAA